MATLDVSSPAVPVLRWVVSCDRQPGGRLLWLAWQKLPGLTAHERRYHTCLDDPEELALFYDDVHNELKVSYQLCRLALEDLTTFQPSLF